MAVSDATMGLDPATGRMRPARRKPAPPPRIPDAALQATGALVLFLYMFSLLIPASFQLGGLNLPVYRILLIPLIVPLTLRFLQDREHPINSVDVLIIAYIGWTALAVYVNHRFGRIVYIGSTALDQFGAYLIGRMLIRHALDYRLFFKYFLWGLLFLLPFAVVEMLFRRHLIHEIVAHVATPGPRGVGGADRLGLKRVYSVFPHAILFGMFCSLGVANFFYIYRDRLFRRWWTSGLAAGMTFMSLSTGPVLAMGLQIILMICERFSRIVPFRLVFLSIGIGVVLLLVHLASPEGLPALLIEGAAFNPQTGWGRLEIYEYGLMEVARNPLFGIGFGEWVRPFWRPSSIDSFWLSQAVRFGAPTAIFIFLAMAVHLVKVYRSTQGQFMPYQYGYLISWIGLLFALSSVAIWGAPSLFVLTYIGAGVWFYGARPQRVPRRAAPATRTPPPAAPGPAAASGRGDPPRTGMPRPRARAAGGDEAAGATAGRGGRRPGAGGLGRGPGEGFHSAGTRV